MSRFLGILNFVGPLILALIPQTAPFAGTIADLIGKVEGMVMPTGVKATGAQKKAAVLAMAVDVAGVANQATNKTIVDPVALSTAISDGIDTVVGVVNLIQAKHPVAPVVAPAA